MDHHANGGGGGLQHSELESPVQQQQQGAGANHWLFWQQMSTAGQMKMPYHPEFVSVIQTGPVVHSYEANLIRSDSHMPSDNLLK